MCSLARRKELAAAPLGSRGLMFAPDLGCLRLRSSAHLIQALDPLPGGEGVVLGEVAEDLGGVGEVPAGAVVARHAVDDDERAVLDLGLDGGVEEVDEVVVGEPHLPGPVVGQGLGAIAPFLDPADPQRDERQVERQRPGSGRAARPPA